MTLNKKEKEFIKLIKRLCDVDETTIIKVFKGLFLANLFEMYANEDTETKHDTFKDMPILIPYIMSYQIKIRTGTLYDRHNKVDDYFISDFSLSDDLKSMLKKINNDDTSGLRSMLLKDLSSTLRENLGIDNS